MTAQIHITCQKAANERSVNISTPGVSGDYDTRHEQAPGTSNLLKIQEALSSKSGGGGNLAANGRKISVEQLFQVI